MTTEAKPLDAGHVYTGRYDKGRHNPERCCTAVHDAGRWPGYHQCTRKPNAFRDVLHHGKPANLGYCTAHDPVTVAAKAVACQVKYDAERAASAARHRLQAAQVAALAAIRQIATGHNDPRTLALETLARYGE